MNKNAIFDPDEYIKNGGYIETIEVKKLKRKRKHKKENLVPQKLYGIMVLFVTYGILEVAKFVPELLLLALILGAVGIIAIVSKEKIIY